MVTLTASTGTVTKNVNGTWAWTFSSANTANSGVATFTATDSDGASMPVTFSPVVNGATNVAPQVVPLSTSAADCDHSANRVVTFTVHFSDANVGDTHSLIIKQGDGSVQTIPTTRSRINQATDTISVTHAFSTGGIFTATVTVVDNANATGSGSVTSYVAGAFVQSSVLTIIGTGSDDEIEIERSGNTLKIETELGDSDDDDDDDGHGCGRSGSHDDDDDDDHHSSTLQFLLSSITSINVMLCSGYDSLDVDDNVTIPITVDGGTGNDEIETGWGNDAIIDLRGNNVVDTGADNVFVRTGSRDDILRGGSGNDILDAGSGNDQLYGDEGRDILIGGIGADRIFGNSGDDILIAGYTSWDGNKLALLKIRDEWTSAGAIAFRVANGKNGTGLTGGYRLNGNDGTTQTVFNDNDADRLTGNSDRDAFWANIVNDNGGVLDLLLDLSSLDAANDTDC